MSQPNLPQSSERLPNEPYYQQPAPQADQRRRWGRLLLIVGFVWLALTIVGNGPWFAGFPFAPAHSSSQNIAGSSLSISTQSDDITLERSADQNFHIEVTARGWGWDGASDDVLRRAGIEIRGEGDAVSVVGPHRGFQFGTFGVELHVAVPEGAPITIETASGDVTASALSSDLVVTTASGDVQLREIDGAINVTTSSGDVRLRDGRALGATVQTNSGDVDLRGVAGQTSVETESGDIAVRDATDAALNLQSASGDVYFEGVLASSGSNTLKSISGDLSMRVGNGALDIVHTTVSGDVDVEVEQQASSALKLRLSTSNGDIQVKGLD